MLFRMTARVTATVVCCILMQILCVASQKLSFSFLGTSSPRSPIPGLRPWTPLGDFVPQAPYRGSAWTPLGSPDPQSSFMFPNNPVRSTPLYWSVTDRQTDRHDDGIYRTSTASHSKNPYTAVIGNVGYSGCWMNGFSATLDC